MIANRAQSVWIAYGIVIPLSILAGVMVMYVPTSIIVPVAVGALVLPLAIKHQTVLFYVISAGLYTLTGYSEGVSVMEVALLGLVGVLILHSFFQLRAIALPIMQTVEPWLKPLVFFLLITLLSTIVGVAVYGFDFVDSLREYPGFVYYLLALPVILMVKTRQDMQHIINVVLVVGALMVVRDLGFVTQDYNLGIVQDIYRVVITFLRSPGTPFFMLLFLLLPLVIPAQVMPPLLRTFSPFLALLSLVVIVLTGTRSYWLGAVFALVIYVLMLPSGSKIPVFASRLAVVALVSLVGLAIMNGLSAQHPDAPEATSHQPLDRLQSFEHLATDWSALARYSEVQVGLDEFSNNPIVGHGMGYPITYYLAWREEFITTPFMHNFLVYLLVKTGIIGTVLYGWFSLRLAQMLYALAHDTTQDIFVTSYARLLLICFLTLWIISLSSAKLNDVLTVAPFMILCGTILAVKIHETPA
ncbi:MAG: O-antigen ligase family protein [Anaerolineae bacterium]|nr:O-antigen ligase family protein [Anaerolineae bacterium]